MNIPVHMLGRSRREKRRAIDKIHREADRKRAASAGITVGTKRRPTTLVIILVMFFCLGSVLIQQAKRVSKEPPPDDRLERTLTELRHMQTAVEIFYLDTGRYPSEREGLTSLVVNPGAEGWNGSYLNRIKPDQWGSPYVYTATSNSAMVISSGPDATPSTEDDVSPPEADYRALAREMRQESATYIKNLNIIRKRLEEK
jgi:general secretion pathway protein G